MQRLSGLDASFLYSETRAQLLHVCGLIVLDVSTMEGGYDFSTMRAELQRRVAAMPGFRRKLHDSLLNVDHPVWIEAEDFDIDHHLHRIAVPSPGGRRELAELAAHLAGQPMDRSMPLWEMWIIEGLEGGKVAVFAKMHHCTVDGVTGANMVSQLCTLTPDDPSLDLELVKENAGTSSALELAVGGALSRLSSPFKLLTLLPGTLGVLPGWIARARRGEAMPAPFTAPRTPFNQTITGHRTISYTSLDFEQVREVKNAFGTTVNDVVLAVCSTALRTYLDSLDVLPAKPLIAMVPMSVRAADHRPGTNRVSGMFMSLSTDIDDPVERLEAIRDSNVIAKDHNNALDANLLTDWAQFAGSSVFGSAVRTYSRLRLSEKHPVVHNLVISNVPGPTFPLYFLGGRITEMFPMGPVFHGAGLNCTVMSLDGQLNVGFIACRDVLPDPWPLAEAVESALATYVEAARNRPESTETDDEVAVRSPKRTGSRSARSGRRTRSTRDDATRSGERSARRRRRAAADDRDGADGAVTETVTARSTADGGVTEVAQTGDDVVSDVTASSKAASSKLATSKAATPQAETTEVPATEAPAKKAPAKKSPAKKAPTKQVTTAKSTSTRGAKAAPRKTAAKRAAAPAVATPTAATEDA